MNPINDQEHDLQPHAASVATVAAILCQTANLSEQGKAPMLRTHHQAVDFLAQAYQLIGQAENMIKKFESQLSGNHVNTQS